MKPWGEAEIPSHGSPSTPEIRSTGPGLVRLDLLVVDPAAAIEGREAFQFAVLEDPSTGDWYGEDPGYPGSALVELDQGRVLPSTHRRLRALEAVAAHGRHIRLELTVRASTARRDHATEVIEGVAEGLPRPAPGDLAVDLGRAIQGHVPPPARWWTTHSEVRLQTVRSADDPLGWIEEWTSRQEMLVADTADARREADRLAAEIGPSDADDEWVDREVRTETMRLLREREPDLADWLAAAGDVPNTDSAS